MGLETDSLNHRAGVCYLPCGFLYDELCHAVGMHSLLVPPSTFLMCFALSQSRLTSFLSKTNVLCILINSHAGLEIQQLNIVGS